MVTIQCQGSCNPLSLGRNTLHFLMKIGLRLHLQTLIPHPCSLYSECSVAYDRGVIDCAAYWPRTATRHYFYIIGRAKVNRLLFPLTPAGTFHLFLLDFQYSPCRDYVRGILFYNSSLLRPSQLSLCLLELHTGILLY